MNLWSFEKASNDEKAFILGVDKDEENKLILNDVQNFRVALTSKRLLNNLNVSA